MTWLEELRDDARRRQDLAVSMRAGPERTMDAGDATVAWADTLVRSLLDQMNQVVLGGRGSVWAAPARWGVYLWELWWEPTREGAPYLVVTLLRDSRGTPYLRVQGRRLALEDTRLERRLQRALRAAFRQPRVYMSRTRALAGAPDILGAESSDSGRTESGSSTLLPGVPSTRATAQAHGPGAGDGARGRSTWARRGGHRDGSDE